MINAKFETKIHVFPEKMTFRKTWVIIVIFHIKSSLEKKPDSLTLGTVNIHRKVVGIVKVFYQLSGNPSAPTLKRIFR